MQRAKNRRRSGSQGMKDGKRKRGRTNSNQGKGKSPNRKRAAGRGDEGSGKYPHQKRKKGGKGRGRGHSRQDSGGRGYVAKAPRGSGFADQFQWVGTMSDYKEQYLKQEKEERRAGYQDPFVLDYNQQLSKSCPDTTAIRPPHKFRVMFEQEEDDEEEDDEDNEEDDSDDFSDDDESDEEVIIEEGGEVEEKSDKKGEIWFQDREGDQRLLQGPSKKERRKYSRSTVAGYINAEEEPKTKSTKGKARRTSLLDFLESEDSDAAIDSMEITDEVVRDYLENTQDDAEDLGELMKRMVTNVDSNIEILDSSEDDDSEDEEEEDEDDSSDEETHIKYDYLVGPWGENETIEEVEARAIEQEKKFQKVLRGEFLPADATMLTATEKPRGFKERLRVSRGGRRRQQSPPRDIGKKGRRRKSKGGEKEEEEDYRARRKGKKNRARRGKGKEDTLVTLGWVREQLDAFLNGDQDYFSLPPMGKKNRAMTHQVASLYRFESRSFGSGKTRHTILYRTIYSSAPEPIELGKILRKFESVPGYSIAPRRKTASVPRPSQTPGGLTRKELDGQVVGGSAAPISEENVGNRLLRGMGWDGGALGSGRSGITAPIDVVIKNNRHGLGFGNRGSI